MPRFRRKTLLILTAVVAALLAVAHYLFVPYSERVFIDNGYMVFEISERQSRRLADPYNITRFYYIPLTLVYLTGMAAALVGVGSLWIALRLQGRHKSRNSSPQS